MNAVIQPDRTSPAHQSLPHESAALHVRGSAHYVDDLPEWHGTLHAALGLSSEAHARIESIDFSAVHAAAEVVAVFTAKDIPGANECGPIIHDDPILADGEVHFVGQPIFMVVAHSREAARRAARMAKINYQKLPAHINPAEAHQASSWVLPPIHLARGEVVHKIAQAPHRLAGQFSVGGQEQFYLEGQISYALPKEDGGIHLYCSTQHPSEMQHVVAHALNLHANQVVVEMRRMGGGFGGKESQSALFAALASVAAQKLQKPVKLRPDRDDDMMITGKRHDFTYDYEVGFGEDGLIHGLKLVMVARCGFSADLSGPVMTRAICHADNAYYLADVDLTAFGARTNTQSNTAFRGFGGPQGVFAIETIVDNIARTLKLDALTVRQKNFYGLTERNLTPYGQKVEDNILQPLVDQLVESSGYWQRRQEVQAFNQDNRWLKKGLAITPVKFGIAFNVPHFNQAGALVHVYVDGSIIVSHGGTEMGQGLNTKVAQVVAHVLGVPMAAVKTTAADTSKVPNTSATAASTGTDLNGKAAENAAAQIRARLAQFFADKFGGQADEVVFSHGEVRLGQECLPFARVCALAYEAKIQLWSDGFYVTPGLHWDREKVCGSPFYYFAYGAAVAEVVIDTLTGESRLIRADIVHDAGTSINPALDIGQVEGAFIQGTGWLTSEELYWNDAGRLMTHAPSTYKIPAVHDCPPIFNTHLYQEANSRPTILRSKAVGEPPLLHGIAVFLAIRDAISSVGEHRQHPPLSAPATPEAILNAVNAVRPQP